jgi:hypothetical protein
VNKLRVFKIIFIVWIVLWVLFLAREDKDGQYRMLYHLYTHDGTDNVRYVVGSDLYDFLVFCKDSIPTGFTYRLSGFKEFSIDEVRARYFLWPLKSVEKDPNFVIIYGREEEKVLGYREYRKYRDRGCILIREDIMA